MKLKNKKTGEIVDTLCQENAMGIAFGIDHHDGDPIMVYYNSLAELNEEWEDYEEPKEYWYIDTLEGQVCHYSYLPKEEDEGDKFNKQIGNYFETKEKAEKAVEKLKAWKRLKDKGFKFANKPRYEYGEIRASIFDPTESYEEQTKYWDDLDLLFGGENE